MVKDARGGTLVYLCFDAPIGDIFVYARQGQPVHVTFYRLPAEARMIRGPLPQAMGEVVKAIEGYFEGREIHSRLACSLLDAVSLSDFERSVLKEVMNIPRGCTLAYRDVAKLAGRERAARATGNALHKNPFPIIIPCHRVIKADGSLGGYGGCEWIKRWLLEYEHAT